MNFCGRRSSKKPASIHLWEDGEAAEAIAAGGVGRQSHWAGWLEKKSDVLAVLAVFRHLGVGVIFWCVFDVLGTNLTLQ